MAVTTLIHQFLESSSDRFPDKVAVVHENRRITYAEINVLSNQLAQWLIRIGVKQKDRIALLAENSIEYIFCYYGILKAGAVAVSLNTDARPEALMNMLKLIEPPVLILSAPYVKVARRLDPGIFSGMRVLCAASPRDSDRSLGGWPSLYEQISNCRNGDPEMDIDPGACAAVIFTSGSEGKPKGVMLSHRNIVANTRSIVECLGITDRDIQMVVLPFHYVMGKSLLNTHFSAGGRIVINNKFAYTASMLKQMADEEVTGFSGVPSTYAHLLFKSPLADYRLRLPALRYCSQAGGHMPKQIKRELLRVLPPQTKLVVMYGATEASARLTFLPPELLTTKIDSIGVPIPGVMIDILTPDGDYAHDNEIGELVARGENIMLGYYRDEEATRRAVDPRGYHTGDLGFRDADGFLFISGRKDEQVKVGGHRINPREIEEVIIESGLIMECIVFPIPDEYLGSKLAGLAVPAPGAGSRMAGLGDYLHNKLAKYKVPDPLLTIDSIPKTSSGKPDRAASMALYLVELGQQKAQSQTRKDIRNEEP